MTFGELLEIVVGEGGQPLEWFWNLRQLKLAELIARGVQRRYRAQWETSRMTARAVSAVWVKNLPEEYPCGRFPWEEAARGRTGEADEATRAAERELADAVMDEMLKRASVQPSMAATATDGTEAAKDGGDINTERDGEQDDQGAICGG